MLSCVLSQFLNDDRTRWHIDSNCKSFSCKDNLDKSLYETLLNCFLEHWNHSSVMARNTASNVINEVVILKRVFIVCCQILAMFLNDFSYLYLFL